MCSARDPQKILQIVRSKSSNIPWLFVQHNAYSEMEGTNGPSGGGAGGGPPLLSVLRQRALDGFASARNLLNVLSLRAFQLTGREPKGSLLQEWDSNIFKCIILYCMYVQYFIEGSKWRD